jgi:hypothetical protein
MRRDINMDIISGYTGRKKGYLMHCNDKSGVFMELFNSCKLYT